jgi:hypothetical protein
MQVEKMCEKNSNKKIALKLMKLTPGKFGIKYDTFFPLSGKRMSVWINFTKVGIVTH